VGPGTHVKERRRALSPGWTYGHTFLQFRIAARGCGQLNMATGKGGHREQQIGFSEASGQGPLSCAAGATTHIKAVRDHPGAHQSWEVRCAHGSTCACAPQ
jgi:hypothetical protein